MGIPFFPTFVDEYLFPIDSHLKHVSLANKNVIIDGNSFFHFVYDDIRREDSTKSMAQRVTATQFGYDGFWIKFRDGLMKFRDKCANVHVVFDGYLKSNDPRRRNPERASSVRFNDDTGSLPSLIREELMNVLHQLQIPVYVAPGEADPMIVQMAREHDAYIVARDVDYHLYEFKQGYVPLPHLNLETLEGRLYHIADIFQGLSQRSVALWATIIAFNFLDFDVLEDLFSVTVEAAKDKKKFRKWLKETSLDDEKRQWLTSQWNLLRYIQHFGEIDTRNKLMAKLISTEHQRLLDEKIESYVTIPIQTPTRTRNGNELPPYLDTRYIKGELDRAIINVLVTGEVITRGQGTHLANLRLLLPMCHILLKWDYQTEENVSQNPTITYNEEQYCPFELVQFVNLPRLVDFDRREKRRQKGFVLGCVDYALEFHINWHGVHINYLLWLSLLKLWFHTRETTIPMRRPILLAMIVSFLKHVLLDTYDEAERTTKGKQFPVKPFLSYSTENLKHFFSMNDCIGLRASIEQHPPSLLLNDDIKVQLLEVEQFYKELTMVNEFCGRPFNMPSPHQCVSQLTFQLAVVFQTSKDIWQEIQNLFDENVLLIDLTKEIYALFESNTE